MKVSKMELDNLAEACAIVHNLGMEVVNTTPVSQEDIARTFYTPWENGDPKLVADISAVVILKDPKFHPRDVEVLAALINAHSGGQDMSLRMAHDKLIVDQANLESSTYEHMKKSLDYDCQQWRVYAGKIHNHSKTVYSQKLQWDSQQHVNALKIADKFLQDNTRLIHIKDSSVAQSAYFGL